MAELTYPYEPGQSFDLDPTIDLTVDNAVLLICSYLTDRGFLPGAMQPEEMHHLYAIVSRTAKTVAVHYLHKGADQIRDER